MIVAAALLVLVAVCAAAGVLACYRLGAFSGKFDALSADHRETQETLRETSDRLSNHLMTLAEKVESSHRTTTEMNRLLTGARAERDQERRRSRPDV